MAASDIRFSKEQAMLADIAGKLFRDRWPIEAVRQQLETETGFDAELWGEIAELGWLGVAVPEAHGGLGQSLAEVVTLVEPMGRHLFASPFLPTQLAIQALSTGGSDEQRERWLPRLASGTIATLALTEADGDWDLERVAASAEANGEGSVRLEGAKSFVLDAAAAELILVSLSWRGDPALGLLASEQIPAAALTREVVIDETRRSYRLDLAGLELDREALITGAAARRALSAVRDAALLLVSAEACGGTAGALDLVLGYLTSRRQFGRPIGSYQALKHPTVDILIGLERSRSHLYHAASVLGEADAEVALRMAKTQASDAFAFAGDRAIQFHGALGFTYECDAQLFLRRALWCQYQYGDSLHHRKRLAAALL